MGYRPKYFTIEELTFPSSIDRKKLWYVLDDRMLITLDRLRDKFGVCVVNDWSSGGLLSNCGLRSFDSPVGKPYSLHKFGRAFDLHFKDFDANTVRESIKLFPYDPAFEYITCVEEDVAWLHIDNRNHDSDQKIMFIKP